MTMTNPTRILHHDQPQENGQHKRKREPEENGEQNRNREPEENGQQNRNREPTNTGAVNHVHAKIDTQVRNRRRPHILLGVCACPNTSRIGHLCSAFAEWADVIVVSTPDALGMFDPLTLPPQIPIHWGQSPGIRRVAEASRLSGWAEALVMAPLSTCTLAKIHAGISDNLLTAAFMSCHRLRIFLALDTTRNLWSNPMTQVHLQDLQGGYRTTSIQPSLTDEFASMDEDLLRTTVRNHIHAGFEAQVRNRRRPRILLGVCASPYTSRIGHLCSAFAEWADVIVVSTHDALGMFDPLTLPPQIPIHLGQSLGIRRVAEARHLSDWAEALVMAPLSTRTLFKIHAGISDNLVTAAFISCHRLRIFLALDTTRNLCSNPMTQVHLQDLQQWYRTTSIQPIITDEFVSMDEDLLCTMVQGSFFPEEN